MSKPSTQPKVPPEALSWCIAQLSFVMWERKGQILTRAHRIAEVERFGLPFHKPRCGAQVAHASTECILAPEGWPACRHCAKTIVSEGAIPTDYFGGTEPSPSTGSQKDTQE